MMPLVTALILNLAILAWLVLAILAVLSVFLWDVDRSALRRLRRYATAAALAAILATGICASAVVIQPLTCNDLEKYSLFWYANWCFWNESSH